MSNVGLRAELGRVRADIGAMGSDGKIGRRSGLRIIGIFSELLDRLEKLERHAELERALGVIKPIA
jgi:hypothetical protein